MPRIVSPVQRAVIDIVLVFTVVVIAMLALASLVVHLPRAVFVTAVAGLTVVALGSVYARLVTRPDHLRAMQSHQILEIANESLAHLRKGLDFDSAGAVCRYALREAEAAAVAITDTEKVLGFAGIGEDHHSVGGPIMTRATREAIEHNEHRILATAEEIGCPRQGCLLRAAVVVPLEVRGMPVGTLKFYYTTPRLLNETQVTLAEGLAKLLSTQLELSELDRQTELACRMELRALQAQINPHFLFNTLNTIAHFIRTDPMEARSLLREFAAFYRRTLESGDELITLERELEYLSSYLSLERARFGERLQVSQDIDPDALGVAVPAFILQPLVENSIQHGMPGEGAIHIRVQAECADAAVNVRVVDDGRGIGEESLPLVLEPGFGKGMGIALKNVDERLKGYFGPDGGLTIESKKGRGTVVSMTLSHGCAPAAAEEG